MVTAWLPEIMRLGQEIGPYRFDDLAALERRLVKAKYLEGSPDTVKWAEEFLQEIGQGAP